MQKLLEKYRAEPTLKNAQALRAYSFKHAMAACMLTREVYDLLTAAIEHANKGA